MVKGGTEVVLTVANSSVAAFGLALLGVGLAILAFFADPLAGAILLGAMIVAFSSLGVYALILRDRFGGLYETLSDESDWDIRDKTGADAVLIKRRRLHFLQDGVFAIRDFAWGAGDVLADYQCSPGKVVDKYSAAGKHNIVISLREVKKRGDTEDYVITRRMKDMFPDDSEWVATEVTQPTQMMAISVRFPADRPPTGAWLKQNSDPDHRRSTLPIEGNPDGRQRISVRVDKPKLRETYTIWWEW
jgi:hypothetical protein